MTKFVAFFMFLLEIISTFLSGDAAKLSNIEEVINAYKNMDEISASQYVGEISDYIWNENDEFDINETAVVKKKKGEDFVVLSLSDIHFADYQAKKIVESYNEIATIKHLVNTVHPDLILLLGDNVCKTSTIHSIRRITDLMESFDVPWAPIFGNHDNEGNCDLNFLADIMMSGEHCLMQKGDPSMGVGNYVVNVAEDGEDGKMRIVESFVMMDSHNWAVYDNQIKWLKWVVDGINEYADGKSEISLVEHIPIPEYQLAIDQLQIGKYTGKLYGKGAYGEVHAFVSCERDFPDWDTVKQRGLFDVLKNSNTAKYVFCGHDHLNNFFVMYDGIRLTYNTKCGANSGNRFIFNGGTVIKINDKGIKSITQKSQILGVHFDYYKVCTQ